MKYLFCFAEPDFAPRQGHQHSAFVAAELQQAQLVCRGGVGEAVGGLLGAADGGLRGRLKRFYPLLPLPCGHTRRREERKAGRWWVRIQEGKRKSRGEKEAGCHPIVGSLIPPVNLAVSRLLASSLCSPS